MNKIYRATYASAPSAVWLAASLLISGCASERVLRTPDMSSAIKAEMSSASPKPAAVVAPVAADPVNEQPKQKAAPEPKIDLLVNNAQARDVFLAIVTDTRYSMLMHPDVKGTLSVTMRGVTVAEALESIRDVYGYDFKIEGRRITIYPATIQTKIFTVNYPNSQRNGNSELKVSSGGVQSSANNGAASAGQAQPSGQQAESSKVSTTSKTDFWGELAGAVKSIVGNGEGRSVITSPQSGIMVVRGMPEELKQVDKFLKAAQIAIERQVMLEAKIVEVELRDGYQSGVNWGALASEGLNAAGVGLVGGGLATTNALLQNGVSISGTVPMPSFSTGGGVFGLALASNQFGAVLGFLETQGDVQTLSSPRVATMNNQKAVLKVGTDSFFVTSVSGGTNSSGTTGTGGNTTTMPTISLSPFFSGISLDVTPQVDEGSNVTLHVHPAVTTVTEVSKQIDLGAVGNYKLPLASSSVNETDTLVKIQDGRIVAIGGLMQMDSARNTSGIPGTTGGPFSALFGNKSTSGRKREVIVLIKPTIIRTPEDFEEQTRRARNAIDEMDDVRARVIKLDGPAAPAQPISSAPAVAPSPFIASDAPKPEAMNSTDMVIEKKKKKRRNPVMPVLWEINSKMM